MKGSCRTCDYQWPIWVGKTRVLMCIKDTYNPKHVSNTDSCNGFKQRLFNDTRRDNQQT